MSNTEQILKSVINFALSIEKTDIKEISAVISGVFMQWAYSFGNKTLYCLILIALTSTVVAYFIIHPLLTHYGNIIPSVMRLPILFFTSLISTIIINSAIHWLPEEAKAFTHKWLGLQNRRSKEESDFVQEGRDGSQYK